MSRRLASMAHWGKVPWHDHEPQVRVTRCRGGEGIEIKLLLGSLRAAGEEDENVVAEARERPQSRHLRGQSIPFTPSKALADAQHIAYAAIAGVDYVLTWNCRHLANAERLPGIYATLRLEGLSPPLIVTPEEFSDVE